jgi:hypothetical protein
MVVFARRGVHESVSSRADDYESPDMAEYPPSKPCQPEGGRWLMPIRVAFAYDKVSTVKSRRSTILDAGSNSSTVILTNRPAGRSPFSKSLRRALRAVGGRVLKM